MTTAVLNVITGLNIGGAEIMLARYLSNLGREVYAPKVLSLLAPGPVARQIEAAGAEVYTFGLRRAGLPALRASALAHAFGPCDLVHGWMYHGNLVATAIAAVKSAPAIWSIHHSLHDLANEKPLTAALIRISARLSSRTHAISYCSRVSADQHEAHRFDPGKRVVIPNGIDCSRFKPDPAARKRLLDLTGIPGNRFLAANVARYHPMKDQVRLVEAIALLRREGVDVHAVLIGNGHEQGDVERKARELGVDPYVTVLPARDDIADLLPAFDVFALTSAWGEAFSIALTEAMASGVPGVATDVGDSAWIIHDPQRIARPGDAASIAVAIGRLASQSPEARREIGLRDRRRVIENFSLADYTRKHTQLYESALAGAPRTNANLQQRS